MHELIGMAAHGPWGLWPEAAAIVLAIMVGPVLVAIWPEE